LAGPDQSRLHADRFDLWVLHQRQPHRGLRGVTTSVYGIGREEVAHTVEEYIEIDKLYEGTAGYTHIVGSLLGAGVPSAS